jgi:cytochrome c
MKRAGWVLLAGAAGILSACGQGGGSPAPADAKKLLAQLPAPYSAADLANGEAHFSLCRSCHTIVQGGADMTGPNLYGVVGRKAASKPGYTYSDALKASGLTWDAATLNQWLSGPQAMVPGTKMSFPGLKDPNDRRDVIGYLKVEGSAPAS